jgi:transposase-like protein
MNFFSLAKAFPTQEAALAYWVKARWPDGVKCLGCGHGKCYQIEAKGKTGKAIRLYECANCGLHFSATTGTLFHDSHLPLQKWFAAIALMVEGKKGISAAQMKRHIGVTYKTAWFLCYRIREAMQEDATFTVGGPSATVEIDETFPAIRFGFSNLAANKPLPYKILTFDAF